MNRQLGPTSRVEAVAEFMALVAPSASMRQRLMAATVLLGGLQYGDLQPEDLDAHRILHHLGIQEERVCTLLTRDAAMIRLRDLTKRTMAMAFGLAGGATVPVAAPTQDAPQLPPLVSRGPAGIGGEGQRETRIDGRGGLVEVLA